jgi:hypothetical protein
MSEQLSAFLLIIEATLLATVIIVGLPRAKRPKPIVRGGDGGSGVIHGNNGTVIPGHGGEVYITTKEGRIETRPIGGGPDRENAK